MAYGPADGPGGGARSLRRRRQTAAPASAATRTATPAPATAITGSAGPPGRSPTTTVKTVRLHGFTGSAPAGTEELPAWTHTGYVAGTRPGIVVGFPAPRRRATMAPVAGSRTTTSRV